MDDALVGAGPPPPHNPIAPNHSCLKCDTWRVSGGYQEKKWERSNFASANFEWSYEEHLHTQNCKELVYVEIEYCLMITILAHKRRKSPFKHSKTSYYVFTCGRVIVIVQIHSRKTILKGVKMTTAKWTSIEERHQDSRYPGARFSEKGVFAGVGVEMP